jgi:hypothetical protein
MHQRDGKEWEVCFIPRLDTQYKAGRGSGMSEECEFDGDPVPPSHLLVLHETGHLVTKRRRTCLDHGDTVSHLHAIEALKRLRAGSVK